MIVNLTAQPTALDFFTGFVWANNNLGQVYRIEFPNGYIEFKIDVPVNNPAPPPLPAAPAGSGINPPLPVIPPVPV